MAKPNNRNKKPQFVNIKYSKLSGGQFNDEVIVTLSSNIGHVDMILPLELVDKSNKTIEAVLIGKRENNCLVDLPNSTFTTGSKVWFPESALLGLMV